MELSAAPTRDMSRFPPPLPRGVISETLLEVLETRPSQSEFVLERLAQTAEQHCAQSVDIVGDADAQLTLFLLYSIHYGTFADVAAWEWNPHLERCRIAIDSALERQLRERVIQPEMPAAQRGSIAAALFELTAAGTGPSLSRYIAKKATLDEAREFLINRSIYTLREADPHSWAIPRLSGRAKAALVEIQSDEYGAGDPSRMHSAIFAQTMRGVGLCDAYGYYIDNVSAVTLASVNTMSMFGFNTRLIGAITGHLAAFEMTSSIPNRMYGNGFRRLGCDHDVTWYFDEHVEADAVHEQIAGLDLAGSLGEDRPDLIPDIMFGAAACLAVDGWASRWMLDRFSAGETSLVRPLS